jgi:hypothetical protein
VNPLVSASSSADAAGDVLVVDLRDGPRHGCIMNWWAEDDYLENGWGGTAAMLADMVDRLDDGSRTEIVDGGVLLASRHCGSCRGCAGSPVPTSSCATKPMLMLAGQSMPGGRCLHRRRGRLGSAPVLLIQPGRGRAGSWPLWRLRNAYPDAVRLDG